MVAMVHVRKAKKSTYMAMGGHRSVTHEWLMPVGDQFDMRHALHCGVLTQCAVQSIRCGAPGPLRWLWRSFESPHSPLAACPSCVVWEGVVGGRGGVHRRMCVCIAHAVITPACLGCVA